MFDTWCVLGNDVTKGLKFQPWIVKFQFDNFEGSEFYEIVSLSCTEHLIKTKEGMITASGGGKLCS